MITTLLQSKLHKEAKQAGILKILCAFMLILTGGSAWAQTVVEPFPGQDSSPETTGTTGTANARQPLSNFFKFERSAAIYLGSEIGTSGDIVGIAYDIKSVNSPGSNIPVRVFLKAIPLSTTSFTSNTTVAAEETNATLVFDGTISPTTTGWFSIDFPSNPFAYNHTTHNLEVIVETNCTTCAGSGGLDSSTDSKIFRFNNLLTNSFQFWYDNVNPSTFPSDITSSRPNIRFKINTTTTPPTCDAPTAASVTTTGTGTGPNTVLVNYTPSSTGASGVYFITYTRTAPTAGSPVTTQLTSNPFSLAGLDAGATYSFTVFKDCDGTPDGTGTISTNNPGGSFTTQAAPTPTCTTPTDLAVTKTSTTAQLTFTDNSGAEPGTFLVKYGAPGFDFATAGTVVSGPPYNIINLTPSTTYEFAVQKTCTNGAPSLVEREQFTTDAAAQPCNPPTAGSATSNNFNELTVSYTASLTGATGNYFIAYTPTSGGTTTTVALTSNPQTITSVPAGTYNFTIYKDCSGIQSTGNPTGTFTVQDAPLPPVCTTGTWLGTTSSDWHTASNWCNGIIPDGSTNVIIPANTGGNPVPNYPVITLNALANNLTIQTNATLTLTSGVLTINGLYTNLGTLIDNGDGSLVFTSPLPQTLGKPGQTITFLDLTTGPGGIVQGGPIRVRRVLTLNGNLTTLGNELTLLADNAVQSMVVNNGTAVVIGTATMEKHINTGNNPAFGYRHLTSPVSNATISQLNDDTPLVVNPTYNSNPAAAIPFPTIFRYDETRVTPATPTFDAGWVSPNDLNEPMVPAVGYTVNMLPVEIDFTGTLNNGPITRTLTRNNPGVQKSGWNFIGNPYPSPIDWDAVNVPAGVEDAAYVFRSSSQYSGSYLAYVNGVPGSGNYIPAMQGFFVRSNVTSAAITFENNDRLTTYNNPVLYRQAETRPLIELTLKDNAGKEDKTYVYFENGATASFDGHFDAYKLPNSGPIPTIYSEAGQEQLAINGLPLSTSTTIIPLGGKVPQPGTWTIQADQIINFLPNQTIYLEDMVTNTLHNLSQQNTYTFSTTQTNLTGRFYLRFGPGATTGISKTDLAAKVLVYPNPNKGEFTLSMPSFNSPVVEATLFNAVGQKVWTKTLQTDGVYLKEKITTQKLPHGVYTLRLETGAGPVQRKIVIE